MTQPPPPPSATVTVMVRCPDGGSTVPPTFQVKVIITVGGGQPPPPPQETAYVCLVLKYTGGGTHCSGPFEFGSATCYTVSDAPTGTADLHAYIVRATAPPDCSRVGDADPPHPYGSALGITISSGATDPCAEVCR